MKTRQVDIRNTAYGDLKGFAVQTAEGVWKVFVSAVEYPDLPLHQAPNGGPAASTAEEAIDQFRRALQLPGRR
jgi:hypothetical protein